ncbi:MAG TPA: UDP-3-O-(3-hydroxymyristoyl)glucosamine N-acyltransferase [Gammaproteobacteria bacterium]|jgi:UDP-3-O-[3-hydroxymyristoyl] glucosamine N-acyltransferase|nr:UDP-3-O-(3-hydroxymyristoyl)glucosamine N-acyltransferase [Gammaproteobacteria bacterium]
MKSSREFTIADLVKGLDVTIQGDANCLIKGVCTIENGQPGHLSFLINSLYRKHLNTTRASAVVLSPKDAEGCTINAIVTKNPHYVYAKIATYFAPASDFSAGIHSTVVVGERTQIDPTACIAAHAVIGNDVCIGPDVYIGPGVAISDRVVIGEATTIDARVSIYSDVKIGKRTRIMSGAVVGCDGFGFAQHDRSWHKVPQLGGVSIGDDVDVGANTTIDRGALEDTVIEDGVKLDNLIQVGHNVRIGAHTIIAGCVGIAGSAEIGKHCMIGGATCINGHVHIADQVMVTGMSSVTKSIETPGIYSSGIVGMVTNEEFRKNNARFHRLGNLMNRVKQLEAIIKKPNDERESQ